MWRRVDCQDEVEERKERGESGMTFHFEGLIGKPVMIVALI